MNENIVSVNCAETQNIEVYWQDEVVLNLDVELMYVKSGQTEIKEYTDKEILPELKNYKKTSAKCDGKGRKFRKCGGTE